MTDRVGQQLGNYQLIHLLGEGGFAEVYLGEHIHLGTQAAIKVLHTQLTSDDVDRFRTEARTIAHLIHPHIVRVLEFGVEGKTPFLVMDYAANGTLRQRHPKGVALPLPLIIAYVKQAADALQYAHDEKLIHRDIKPENMLLGRRNDILLSDFGIALVAQSSRYQSAQEMAGTMAYMAPEQIQGKPRPASDQYSLGIVVYEWLGGDRPFHGSLTELVGQHLSVPPPSLQEKVPELAIPVGEAVLTALAKDPKQRFASVQVFAAALEQAYQSSQHHPSASSVIAIPPSQSPLPNVNAPPIQPSLPTDIVEAVLPNPLPLLSNTVIPPSQLLQPTIAATSTSTPTVSPPSTEEPIPSGGPQPPRHRISRRAMLITLSGLAVAGGGLTWLALSQRPGTSSSSFRPTITPSPTRAPSHTPTPIPVGTTLLTYPGHSDKVNAVAWSPDGRHIASASGNFFQGAVSKDNTVQVWEATTGNLVYTYHGHTAPVLGLAWSPDGSRIASGSADMTVQIWDATDGHHVVTYHGHSSYGQGAYEFSVAWSLDGNRIASATTVGTVQVWNAATKELFTSRDGRSPMEWSPNGRYIVSTTTDLLAAQVWEITSGQTLVTYHNHPVAENVPAALITLAWSHDSTRIASGGNGGPIEVWNATSGRYLNTYSPGLGQTYAAAWSPNDKTIASGGNYVKIHLWDVTTGKTLFTYPGHGGSVRAVAWSLDGTRIASGSDDTTVQIWQAS